MKRWVIIIAACLAIGALLNVIVAWRLAMFPVDRHAFDTRRLSEHETLEAWSEFGGEPTADLSIYGVRLSRIGVSELVLNAETPDAFHLRSIVSHGWPMRSLEFRANVTASHDGNLSETHHHVVTIPPLARLLGISPPPDLPMRPRPIGFIINTLLWGAATFILLWWIRTMRRRVRLDYKQCAACGYPLSSSAHEAVELRCSECGLTSDQAQRQRPRYVLRWWMTPLVLPAAAFLAYWFIGRTWWGEIRFWADASLGNATITHLHWLLLYMFIIAAMAWSSYRDRALPHRIVLTWAAAILLVAPAWCAAHLLVVLVTL